jgi:predicted transcriptional regulator
MAEQAGSNDLLALTSMIVSAHLSKNSVATSDVPALIASVHASLVDLGKPSATMSERPKPAVPIKKSVTPDYIVCLEDGLHLKMLKRHLRTAYNLTPDQYRARWGLPVDYPMVAPNYARQRSKLAKEIGLGRKTRKKK